MECKKRPRGLGPLGLGLAATLPRVAQRLECFKKEEEEEPHLQMLRTGHGMGDSPGMAAIVCMVYTNSVHMRDCTSGRAGSAGTLHVQGSIHRAARAIPP